MPHPAEISLQLLQKHIKHSKQIKQIHSFLITNNLLLFNPNTNAFKWICTLLYNTLIRAYLHTDPHNSLVLHKHMLVHRVPPNSHTYPSLVKAASLLRSSKLHLLFPGSLYSQVIRRGVLKDPFVETSFLCLFAENGNLGDARKVFDEMPEPCVVSYNAMLDALCKNGEMGSAVLVFQRMPVRDVVSWTSVVNGYGRNECFYEAIVFFRMMMVHGDVREFYVKPNEATFVSVLSSCANLLGGGGLYYGKQIHAYMIKNERELTVFMGTAMIALYGKLGCLVYAVRVFDNMVDKQVCAWNALISSLAMNSMENHALDMFEKMKSKGVKPNEVTFVAVLVACARANLVELGLELFESMSRVSRIVPRMEHYGCVVDLLGRAGLLTEAQEFIRRMPFEADASVLGALMGACKVHGAIEYGNEVAKRVMELQPLHCGRYVLLSSIYAEADRWDNAAELRKAMDINPYAEFRWSFTTIQRDDLVMQGLLEISLQEYQINVFKKPQSSNKSLRHCFIHPTTGNYNHDLKTMTWNKGQQVIISKTKYYYSFYYRSNL
ncbi:putative pentatricopeptide repeat-containing protein At1g10330 isoform X3 [Daucus carota subsp. sativus]|uniref:putative pentatricopeptide repeat-containing protein At1g10330 isoform X3 n=1 Tax=Daucus carota subsp. sativus TaxID=79200 RepID=UPI0030830CDD